MDSYDSKLREYNYWIEFADWDRAQRYAQERGFVVVDERKCRKSNGVKKHYLCKYFWQKTVRCSHKLSLLVADNYFLGKTTDGGLPHEHDKELSPILAPRSLCKKVTHDKEKTESFSHNNERQDSNKIDYFRNKCLKIDCSLREYSPLMLKKMEKLHEALTISEKKSIMKQFAKLPYDKREKFLERHKSCMVHKRQHRRRAVKQVFKKPRLEEELLQQSHLSALGIDINNSFSSSSPKKLLMDAYSFNEEKCDSKLFQKADKEQINLLCSPIKSFLPDADEGKQISKPSTEQETSHQFNKNFDESDLNITGILSDDLFHKNATTRSTSHLSTQNLDRSIIQRQSRARYWALNALFKEHRRNEMRKPSGIMKEKKKRFSKHQVLKELKVVID